MILETGSGVVNANCYASIQEADNYADLTFDDSWISLEDDEKERRLILSTRRLDRQYQGQWIGTRKTAGQGLAWPRVGIRPTVSQPLTFFYPVPGLTDSDGFSLEDQVPRKLKQAVIELSKVLDPTVQSGYPSFATVTQQNLRSESITVGSVAISNTYTDQSVADVARVIPAEVEDLLVELVQPGTGHYVFPVRY